MVKITPHEIHPPRKKNSTAKFPVTQWGYFPHFLMLFGKLPLLNKFLEIPPRHPPSPQIVEGGGGGATK